MKFERLIISVWSFVENKKFRGCLVHGFILSYVILNVAVK
jgi:hypothetical protein